MANDPAPMPSPPDTPSSPLRHLPSELRAFWITLLSVGVLSLLYSSVLAAHDHNPFASYIPLSSAQERFGDFTVFWDKFDWFHTAGFFTHGFPLSYPAPVALAYQFFLHHAGPHPLVAFVTFSVVALLVPALLFTRALVRHGLAAPLAIAFGLSLVVFSWPGILVVDRGNMEILVWIALASATWAFSTNRPNTAAILFGLAASLKLFPFVFLGLFLSTRDFKRLLLGIASFFAISVLSLALLGPTIPIAYRGIQNGVLFFRNAYMPHWTPSETGVDHSLFALYKSIAVRFLHHDPWFVGRSLPVYLGATALLGVLLYLFRIRKLPLVNQILCFSIACILFTAFSGDGTLLHLYDPFALLAFLALGRSRTPRPVPGLLAALVCLGLILPPMSFAFRHGLRFEGQVHSVLLLVLFCLALVFPFGPSLEQSIRSPRSLLAHLDPLTPDRLA